jgi:hypothetical protein
VQRQNSCWRGRTVPQKFELLALFNFGRASMTCVDAGALVHARGSGHPVFRMHSHVTYMRSCRSACGRRGTDGPVFTVTAYMAQIPGVSDRMTRRKDKSECICCVFSLFHLVLTATSLLQFTSHGVNAPGQGN